MLKYLENVLADTQRLGTVLHIGAGRCTEWAKYTYLDAEKIILVEPVASFTDKLRKKIKSHDSAYLVPKAVVSIERNSHALFVMNNPRYSSIYQPENICNRFPNLSISHQDKVDTVTVKNLLTEFPINFSPSNLLVIEAAGMECELLDESLLTDLFPYVSVKVCQPEDYKNCVGMESVVSTMEKNDYFLCLKEENEFGQHELYFRKNLRAVEAGQQAGEFENKLSTLAKKYGELENEREKLSEHVASLQDSYEKARQEYQLLIKTNTEMTSKLNKLEKENKVTSLQQDTLLAQNAMLDAKHSEVEQQNQQLRSDIEKANKDLVAQKEIASKKVEELTNGQAELKQENKKLHEEKESVNTALTFRIAELEKANKDLSSQKQGATTKVIELENGLAELKKENQTLHKEKESANTSLTSHIAELESVNKDLLAQKQVATEKIAELTNGQAELKQENQKLQEEKESANTSLTSRIAELENANKDLFAQKQVATEKVAELKNGLAELKQENQKLHEEKESANTSLTSHIAELENANKGLLAQKQVASEKITELTNVHAEMKQENQKLLEEEERANATLTSRIAELENANKDLLAQKQIATEKVAELANDQSELKKENENQGIKFSQRNKELEERSVKVAEEAASLKAKLEEAIQKRDDTERVSNENKTRADALQTERNDLKKQMKEKERSTSLGQKMLAKAQVDLEHLRNSYRQKVESERELVELVNELKEKLTLASKYYFRLQQEHPELLTTFTQEETK